MTDPVSGILTREKLKALADAPYGQALKEIRKIDPWYGHPPGAKVELMVIAVREIEGAAFIKAADMTEAKELAKKLKVSDFEWDTSAAFVHDQFEIESIGGDE